MPSYTYECSEGHRTVERHPISLIPREITCGACGKPALKIIASFSGSVFFRGEGFESNAYRGGQNYKEGAEAE